jgi:II/X family phage/plasmid replication protein
MKVLDDESVKADIRAAHFRQTKSGKISYSFADDVFSFYRELREYGYLTVRKSRLDTDAGKRKFNRYVEALQEAGISKATLQTFSLNGKRTNVVPILRFIEMDFSSQHPDWYVEPVSQFYIGHPALSLVA